MRSSPPRRARPTPRALSIRADRAAWYALALTLAVLAPLLRPGYLLLRDAVSTPRSYLSDAALGLTEAAPRAVPQDFAVAVASRLVDGGVVVKAALLAGVWLAGWGTARLVALVLPQAGVPGQLAAVTVAVWNPYVAERLLQGHWSLLVGYGCLPWVAAAALRLRGGASGPAAVLALVFWIALAGLTPTGLLLAATVALACGLGPGAGRSRLRCVGLAVTAAAAAALPWLTAVALSPAAGTPDAPGASGAAAFAARAEPGLATLGSLAGLGGIWNAEAVPGSRATPFALLGTVVLLAVVAVGLPAVVRRGPALPLLVLAAVAVAGVALAASGPGVAALSAAIDAAPVLGVVRDGHKWVALAVPGYALAGAGAVLCLRRWMRPRFAGLLCCLAVIAALPDLVWGVADRVDSVRYPPGWPAVAASINADPRPVAVLPAGSMRRFDWAGPAPLLDPLPRWVRAEVLVTGDLTVSGRTVPGEGSRARAVQTLLLAGGEPAALHRAGVGWVLAESGSAGEFGAAADTLASLPVFYRDGELSLYRIGGAAAGAPGSRGRLAVAAHVLWLALLAAGAAGLAAHARRAPAQPG